MKEILFCSTLILTFWSKTQTLLTYKGAYDIGIHSGQATYNYFDQNGKRVLDGNFTFYDSENNYSESGKYSKGLKNGIWTIKKTSSTYQSLPVKKTELIWNRVSESHPFKEMIETKTENWINDKKDGLSTKIISIKNSWGYPAPGGSSTYSSVIKLTYKSDNLISIDCVRKKNEISNLSIKGSFKGEFADGNWIFNDSKNSYSYIFSNGILMSYEIKDLGTGSLIKKEKIEVDNTLINEYLANSENTFEIANNKKLIVQKVNENLSITKICELEKNPVNFVDLNIRQFNSAFGEDITPFEYDSEQIFAFSPSVICKVINLENWYKLDEICFKSISSESKFLNLACNSKNQFLNLDWNKSYHTNSYILLQLKAYLYKGDIESIKWFKDLVIKTFDVGKNDTDYNKNLKYLLFLTSVSLGEKEGWETFINDNYNKNATLFKSKESVIYQDKIRMDLKELRDSTNFIKTNIDEVFAFLTSKDTEVKIINDKAISTINELKIGNQVWMAKDINYLPSNQEYKLIKNDTLQQNMVGEGIVLYSISNTNKSICPSGWRMPTTSDWDKLVNTLGGDRVAAGNMLKIGNGSGFETNFPSVNVYSDGYTTETSFSLGEDKAYLSIDSSSGNLKEYWFERKNGRSQSFYLPCRCIKE